MNQHPHLQRCEDSRLDAARRYILETPGKQLRARLCTATAIAVRGSPVSAAESAATAIELLHTYSLIHDDLPAMDNDDLRRGRPTLHRAFDEATAILVGDGLQASAFELLAGIDSLTPAVRLDLIQTLARAVGFAGMVGGQALDIAGEQRLLGVEELSRIHALKTGALIRAAVAAGAICADADAEQRAALDDYAASIGLAFQIADDILDVTASSTVLGKTAGKDAASGKSTFVALMGIDGASDYAEQLLASACAALGTFADNGDELRELARQMVYRSR